LLLHIYHSYSKAKRKKIKYLILFKKSQFTLFLKAYFDIKKNKGLEIMKENILTKACLDYMISLENQGLPVMATRTNSGKILTRTGYAVQLCRAGYPDITCLIKGKFVGLECKTGHNQTPEQKIIQKKIENAGGVYLIIRNIGELKQWILNNID